MAWLLVDRQALSFLSPPGPIPSAASVTPTSSLSSQSQLRRNRIKGSVRPSTSRVASSLPLCLSLSLRPNGAAAHPSAALASPSPIHCLPLSLSLFALSLKLCSRNSSALYDVFILPLGMDDSAIGRGGSMITTRELFYPTLKT